MPEFRPAEATNGATSPPASIWARRMLGKQLFGITAPLLLTSDGEKMGKTETGAIWLDADRTSPYAFYQYWSNVDDADVMRCIAYLTEIDKSEYDALAEQTASDPGRSRPQETFGRMDDPIRPRRQTASKAADRARKTSCSVAKSVTSSDAELNEIFADVPSHDADRATLGR